MDKKMQYETPTLTEVGSFEEITQGTGCGSQIDFSKTQGDDFDPNFVQTCFS
ncbi:MAG: lasso peptide [Pseudomonadota bacterium]